MSNVKRRNEKKKMFSKVDEDEKGKRLEIDEVFENIVGGYGPFQRNIFWLIGLTQIYGAFHNIHMVYMGAQPKFICKYQNETISDCPQDGQKCDAYEFPGQDFTSIVSEWSLVCDKSYLASSVQSIYMAGFLIGNLIFGSMSDKYGRHGITWSTILGMLIFSIAGTFSPSYSVYAAMRFMTGVFCGGYGIVSFVIATELLGKDERSLCGLVYPIMFASGIAVYSVLAYLIRDWRQLSFVCALPGLLGILFRWYIPESPRWLASNGKILDAEAVLTKMAVRNGISLDQPIQLKHSTSEADKPNKASQYGTWTVFQHPVLRWRILISIPSWLVFSMVYYGLTMSAGNLGSNMYMSVSLSGMVEIPCYIGTMYILDRLGRRYTVSASMFISGLPCVGILMLPADAGMLKVIFGLIGKMAVSIAFAVAFIYVAELFPTVLRNNTLGMCSTAARVGGIIAPMLGTLEAIYPSLDYLVYGILSISIAILTLKLPETTGKSLPETPEDVKTDDAENIS